MLPGNNNKPTSTHCNALFFFSLPHLKAFSIASWSEQLSKMMTAYFGGVLGVFIFRSSDTTTTNQLVSAQDELVEWIASPCLGCHLRICNVCTLSLHFSLI